MVRVMMLLAMAFMVILSLSGIPYAQDGGNGGEYTGG